MYNELPNDTPDNAMPSVCPPIDPLELAESGWFQFAVPSDEWAFPFLWTVAALRDWTAGRISGRDLARTLRKVASEVSHGR